MVDPGEMSSVPRPLPAGLEESAFDVASGIAAGLTPAMLRHPRLLAPHHGARSTRRPNPAGFLSDRVTARAEAYLPLLRRRVGEVFSHTTALLLLGAPIVALETLYVTVPRPHRAVRRPEIHGHTLAGRLELSSGAIPCVAPTLALIQSAPLLPFRELVIAVDHFLAPRGRYEPRVALLTREGLQAAAEASRSRGISRLRAALEVAREGAESRGESMLHFELAAMGIDDLEIQGVIRDADGNRVGRFDEVDRARKRILEFDGEQHRTDRVQYLKDIRRREALEELGYTQRVYHTEDFSASRSADTRRAICAYLGVTPRPVARHLTRYFTEPYR